MAEIASLPLFHQVQGQAVLVLGDGEAAEPKRRLVERAGGVVIADKERALEQGARIAFVAYDDPKACEEAADELRSERMLVNVVDRPDLCDFTTPSLLDRNPLLIAVGTGGASAGLAKHVRLRLDRILPQSLGKLADALKSARPALRQLLPDGGERRRAIDSALREGGALDPMDSASHTRVDDWSRGKLAAEQTRIEAFRLTSGDPEDLSIRQARLLGEADLVLIDADPEEPLPASVLARARADAQRAPLTPVTRAWPHAPDWSGLCVILIYRPAG